MKTKAAILVETGKPLKLVDLEIPKLAPGQVLVKVIISGICQTQLLEFRGHRGEDRYLPHCLGHEGCGTVLEIGDGVTKCRPDDRVVLSWIKGSGMDVPGTEYGWNGKKVNAGGVTTFQDFTVVSENRVTVIPRQIRYQDAALLGCAVPTGMGAVFNTARPRPGQSLAVLGVGGVGLCAVAAAVIAGCCPITAVDIDAERLRIAKTMGADVTVLADEWHGTVDYAIEASGQTAVMLKALKSVRDQGGTAVVIGNVPHGAMLSIDPHLLNQGRRLLGTWGGDNVPDRDFPRYCQLILNGRLDLNPLHSAPNSLTQATYALRDWGDHDDPRPMIDMRIGRHDY